MRKKKFDRIGPRSDKEAAEVPHYNSAILGTYDTANNKNISRVINFILHVD
jgi:hypothetical protein